MNKLPLIFSLLAIFSNLFSQKIDFDNFFVEVESVKLPRHYTDPTARTFKLDAKSTVYGLNLQDAVKVYGFNKVDDNATVDVYVAAYPIYQGRGQSSSRHIEEKNKEGKITASYNLYKFTSVTTGVQGYVRIYGPKTESKREMERRIKKEEKEKEKAKEKPKEENPFLSNVETAPVVEVKETDQKKLTSSYYINTAYEYSTGEYRSYNEAANAYEQAIPTQMEKFKESYIATIISGLNSTLNDNYGFGPTKNRIKLVTMDSEKHPENKNYNNALQAVKAIFAKLKYNESSEQVQKDLKAVMDYLESCKSKYNSDEKADKKIRHWSSWNLAQIYLALDNLDKAAAEVQFMIGVDYDKGDAESVMEDIEDLKEDFNRIKVNSRHISGL